jgi:hypothetical protein
MKIWVRKAILLTVMIAAYLFLGRCIIISRLAMEYHWCEALGFTHGASEGCWRYLTATSNVSKLPLSTEIALRYGVLIPVVGLLGSIGVAGLFRRDSHIGPFMTGLLVVAIVSLILTAYYCYGLAAPSLCITYRMS